MAVPMTISGMDAVTRIMNRSVVVMSAAVVMTMAMAGAATTVAMENPVACDPDQSE